MKKYLLLALALILGQGLIPAMAANSCPYVYVQNAASSNPVVVHDTLVHFAVGGWTPAITAYLNGNVQIVVDDPTVPLFTFTFAGFFVVLPYGNHTMRAGIDPSCTLDFTVAPPPPLAPAAPTLTVNGEHLNWNAVNSATSYQVFIDGSHVATTSATSFFTSIPDCEFAFVTVKACNAHGCSPYSNGVSVDGTPPGQPYCNDQ